MLSCTAGLQVDFSWITAATENYKFNSSLGWDKAEMETED